MLGAGLNLSGDLGDDFLARQMRRQALVALLGCAAAMSRNQLGLFHGFGQPLGRIRRFVRIAKVDPQLIRVGDVPFASRPKPLFPQLQVFSLRLVQLRFQLPDDVLLLRQLNITLGYFSSLRC